MTETELKEILRPYITRAHEAGRALGRVEAVQYSRNGFASAVSTNNPAELKESQFIPEDAYEHALKNNYFDAKGDKIESSRQKPAELPPLELGTWKLDSFVGPHGRKIKQLVEFDPHDLLKAEPGLVESNFENRGEDSDRYYEWILAGLEPPPIDVVQTVDDEYKIADGHRRARAAKKAGIKIRAWCSPLVNTGDFDAAGNPIKTGLTFELAAKYHEPEPSRNAIPTATPDNVPEQEYAQNESGESLPYARKSIGKYWREQDVTRKNGKFQTPARRSRMSWVQTEDGKPVEYADGDYDFTQHPEYQQLLAAVHENPLEATTHHVLADWLDEQNQPDEAAFRRSMGQWVTAPFITNPHIGIQKPDISPSAPWTILPAKTRIPAGINPDHIPRLAGWGDLRQTTPEYMGIPRSPGSNLYWKTFPAMEEALRRAFHETRRRQREQQPPTQAARYGMVWQTAPIEYVAERAPAGGVTIAGKFFRGGEYIPAEVMTKASPEERAAVESGEARGKPLPPERKRNLSDPGESGDVSQEADAKSRTILERLRGLPRAAVEKAKANVQEKYQRLVARYGPRYGKAIIGAAIASLPIPVPGAALALTAPLLALAELHRSISGGVALGGNYVRYADDEPQYEDEYVEPTSEFVDAPYDPNAEKERQRQAFVQAIAKNPHESNHRVVFADWLNEHGSPEDQDEAAFQRSFGNWLQRHPHPYQPGEDDPLPWKMNLGNQPEGVDWYPGNFMPSDLFGEEYGGHGRGFWLGEMGDPRRLQSGPHGHFAGWESFEDLEKNVRDRFMSNLWHEREKKRLEEQHKKEYRAHMRKMRQARKKTP